MESNTGGYSFGLLLPVTSRGAGGVGVRSLAAVEASLKGFVQVKGHPVFSVMLGLKGMSRLRWQLPRAM